MIVKKIYSTIIETIGMWDDVAYRLAGEPLDWKEFRSEREEALHCVDVEFRMYINKNNLVTEEDIEKAADVLEFAICRARNSLIG